MEAGWASEMEVEGVDRKVAIPTRVALELEEVEGRAAALEAEVLLLVGMDGPEAGTPVAARTRVGVSSEVVVLETVAEV